MTYSQNYLGTAKIITSDKVIIFQLGKEPRSMTHAAFKETTRNGLDKSETRT